MLDFWERGREVVAAAVAGEGNGGKVDDMIDV